MATAGAEVKAKALLKKVIGADAYADAVKQGYIEVVGSDKYTYRVYINGGMTGNIRKYTKSGVYMKSMCIHLPAERNKQGYCDFPPPSDHFLAQVLMLLTDAENFNRIAY